MNQNPQNPNMDHPKLTTSEPTVNNTFAFLVTIHFEIDVVTAANLLAENQHSEKVHTWLLSQRPKDDYPYAGNASDLRAKFGAYLVERETGFKPLSPPPF